MLYVKKKLKKIVQLKKAPVLAYRSSTQKEIYMAPHNPYLSQTIAEAVVLYSILPGETADLLSPHTAGL